MAHWQNSISFWIARDTWLAIYKYIYAYIYSFIYVYQWYTYIKRIQDESYKLLSENNLENYQKHNFSSELINTVITSEEQKEIYSTLNYEIIKIIKIIYSYSVKFKKKNSIKEILYNFKIFTQMIIKLIYFYLIF